MTQLMNIKEERNDALNGSIIIDLKADEYLPKVDKALKEHQKKASMPGFRPGKVPFGVVKKMYGKSVLLDEVNKILSDSLYNYINEKQLKILGNPIPNTEKTGKVDFDNPSDLNFVYDLGYAPEFTLNISNAQTFKFYEIKVTPEELERAVENISKRNGKLVDVEVAEENDLLHGIFTEVDDNGNVVEGGITSHADVALARVNDDNLRNTLSLLKKGANTIVEPEKISDNDTDRAAMLGITKEQEATIAGKKFKFELEAIKHLEPAEINEELLLKMYPAGDVKTLDDLKKKIEQDIKKYFETESERKLKNDIVLGLLKETNLTLPDAFLKRWLLVVNEKGATAEQIEQEYYSYKDGLKWQLIENKVISDNQISVSEEELKEGIRKEVLRQFEYFGMPDPGEEVLQSMIQNFMKNKDEIRKVNDKMYDEKTLAFYKEKFNIQKVEVTQEEFYNLAAAQTI
jgi:trigger factor